MIQKHADYEIETDPIDTEPVGEPPEPSVGASHTHPQSPPSSPRRWGGLLSRMAGSLLTTSVLLGFAGLFYVGHHYDWQLPKFRALLGTPSGDVDDWCLDHAVPESICVECNPALLSRQEDHGWCKQHGVHNCLFEHPELAQLKEPPSKGQLADDLARSEIALAVSSRKENNSLCTLYQKRIQFASAESVRQAGVDVGLVGRGRIVESVTGNGEIVYDPTRRAKLSARAPGSVWSIEKNVGDSVRKGELVALVDATQVGTQKSELLRAMAEEELQQLNVARLRAAKDAVAGSRLLEAEAALAKARADVLHTEQAIRNLGLPVDAEQLKGLSESAALEALRLLGIPRSARDRLEQQSTTANLLPIVAPMDGIVIDRSVSLGEVVDASHTLFEVADTKQMWLKLSVPLEKVEQLSIGQRMIFRPDGSTRELEGRLDWVSTGADSQTRMVDVRAVLDNREGRLRDSTFGTGKVILRDVADAITIPTQASHWEGCCRIAFVRHKNYFSESDFTKLFHVRSVRLGATFEGRTEVIAGLLPGEVVAVEGSDVLRAQLLKNGLGAGCCVEE